MAKQRIVDDDKRKPFCVEKSGNVQVPVYRRQQTKGDRVYTSYAVAEFQDGKRRLHTFGSLEHAQEKARAVAKAITKGTQSLGTLSEVDHLRISEALTLTWETGMDDFVAGARLLRDACKLVGGPDQLLLACQYYVVNRPAVRITPKVVSEAVADYNSRRKGKLSARRARTETCYLRTFEEDFEGRNLHEITALELSDALDRKGWSAKTRNDFLGTLGLLFADAITRGWGSVNIAKNVKRGRVIGGEVGIFTPAEAKALLSSLSWDLRPAIALWCFSGLRKEEIARLDWAEVNQGLASGAIYLPGRKAKTGLARSVPISSNLRNWLERYRKPCGQVLPEQWNGRDLDSLTRHLSRASGITWKDNAPRHSFATYALGRHSSKTSRWPEPRLWPANGPGAARLTRPPHWKAGIMSSARKTRFQPHLTRILGCIEGFRIAYGAKMTR